MEDLKNSKYDLKLLILTLALVSFAFIVYLNLNATKYVVRYILESKVMYFSVWVISCVIFILHFFKHKRKNLDSETIITDKLGDFMDNALGGVTYSTLIATSLTLIKGLYIQQFFTDKTFFHEFDSIDLTAVFGVSLFILYFSLMRIIKVARETYLVDHTEKVRVDKSDRGAE